MYGDRPAQVNLRSDSIAEKYSKTQDRTYGNFRVLQVTENCLTVAEVGIRSTILIDRAILAKRLINNPQCSQGLKSSSKDKPALYETTSYKEAVATFSRNEDFYTYKGLPITTRTNIKTSNKDICDSKEAL